MKRKDNFLKWAAPNAYWSEDDFVGAGFRRRRRVVKVEENRGFLVLNFDVIENGGAAGGERVGAATPRRRLGTVGAGNHGVFIHRRRGRRGGRESDAADSRFDAATAAAAAAADAAFVESDDGGRGAVARLAVVSPRSSPLLYLLLILLLLLLLLLQEKLLHGRGSGVERAFGGRGGSAFPIPSTDGIGPTHGTQPSGLYPFGLAVQHERVETTRHVMIGQKLI